MAQNNTPVKALVLAGGGARGSYQVGVWRALTELGWRPQIITGTSVGSLNGLRDLTGEVEAAGHVEHVDLAAVVFHGSHGQRNGDLAADLFGIVVTNGIAVGNSAQTVRAAGEIQHALSEGGLAAAAVAKQHDIADVFCTHNGSVSFRKS